MERQRSRWITLAVVAGVGVGVWACDAGEMMADAMIDAGGRLVDAGEQVHDAASSDAEAQLDAETPAPGPTLRVFDVPCDVETVEHEFGVGQSFRFTHWHAEVRDESIDPATLASIGATGCGFEGAEMGLDRLACSTLPVTFEAGVARVHCRTVRDVDEGCMLGEGCTDWVESDRTSSVESVRVSLAL